MHTSKKTSKKSPKGSEMKANSQVYCDGACKPNPGIVYIGVYCADPVIEIARKGKRYGTNNEAECLAAIAALEECKRLGMTDVQLLCDSELVCGWTKGYFKWKSNTAFEYVPTIRRLFTEVKGWIEWIPGKRNLADKLSRSLMPTAQDRSLAAMKSGRDQFSKLKLRQLIEAVGFDAWNQIVAKIDEEKYQLSAMRWLLRGLPIESAIRKVEVDRELGRHYREYYSTTDN